MEIKPVKPVVLDMEQGRGRTVVRDTGSIRHGQGSPVDEVGEFSFRTLLKMADAALAAGDPAVARDNYVTLLQYEPENVQALYGKMLAEGADPKADPSETVQKLKLLLNSATDDQREHLAGRAGSDLTALGKKIESDALNTLLRDITPASYSQYATRMEQVLLLYENAAQTLPTHEGMLLAMISTAEHLMVPHRDRATGKRFHPPVGIYEKGKEWLRKARELLKKKFPNRFQRLMLYKKYQTCFVATAAWGDPFADEVVTLRAFRDLYLKPYPLGRRFIRFYYRYGALAALPVQGSRALQGIVRMVLAPVVWVIRLAPGVGKGINR